MNLKFRGIVSPDDAVLEVTSIELVSRAMHEIPKENTVGKKREATQNLCLISLQHLEISVT